MNERHFRAIRTLVRVVIASALVAGCAPIVGLGGWSGMLLVVGASLALGLSGTRSGPLANDATAAPPVVSAHPAAGPVQGPPPPPPVCTGSWHSQCTNGVISKSCCPKNAKCNYAYSPHVDCGYNRCVSGHDVGLCPAPEPQVLHGTENKEACQNKGGQWERACAQSIAKEVCIAPVPTNYMGPPRNPKFQVCSQNRCTTGPVRSACYPTRKELANTGKTECNGQWRKTCVEGKIAERCLP
ncbi:MAG: hypothetical protein ACI9OJ_003264, partial [Myxococcota bacterium]